MKEASSPLPVSESQWPTAYVSRAFVLSEMPEGRQEALRIFNGLVQAHESLSVRCEAIKILFKLDCCEEAQQCAAEWLRTSDEEGLSRSLLAYVAGTEGVDEERLLVIAGQSWNRQCDVQFFIGMKLLGEGSPEAYKYLEACAETWQMNRLSFCWARALLRNLRAVRLD